MTRAAFRRSAGVAGHAETSMNGGMMVYHGGAGLKHLWRGALKKAKTAVMTAGNSALRAGAAKIASGGSFKDAIGSAIDGAKASKPW